MKDLALLSSKTRTADFERLMTAPTNGKVRGTAVVAQLDPTLGPAIKAANVQQVTDFAVNRTLNIAPRTTPADIIRTPFDAVRKPTFYEGIREPIDRLRVVPGGAEVATVTKTAGLVSAQPPETIAPGATVNGIPLEQTQIIPAEPPTVFETAIAQTDDWKKYGLIALGAVVLLSSMFDKGPKKRRRRKRGK